MKLVLAGSIGRLPVGGHAWVDLNYLAGLTALGHEVWYLEECGEGSWVYDWKAEQITTDLDYPTSYVRMALDAVGLGGRWIYRAGDAAVGMNVEEFQAVCADADVLLIRGCTVPRWRSEYELPAQTIFIDADPGFTQIRAATGDVHMAETIRRSDRLFTVGPRIGQADCGVPTLGRRWEPTVAPIHLPLWPLQPGGSQAPYTSILQWRSYADVTYDGRSFGNKDREFPAYADVPLRLPQRFLLAVTGIGCGLLDDRGWETTSGWKATYGLDDYKQFIASSRGEFSVAKHGYVAMRSGWFSDRSVCYLATGRPVIVQDTGLDWLTDGRGVLPFSDPAMAVKAVRRCEAEYDAHSRAARNLAEEVFAADCVLAALLDAC